MSTLPWAGLACVVMFTPGCLRTSPAPLLEVEPLDVVPDPLTVGVAAARVRAVVTSGAAVDQQILGIELEISRLNGNVYLSAALDNPTTIVAGAKEVVELGVSFSPRLSVDEVITARLFVSTRDASGDRGAFAASPEVTWIVIDPYADNVCDGPCPWFPVGGSEIAPHSDRIRSASGSGAGVSAMAADAKAATLAWLPGSGMALAYQGMAGGGDEVYARVWLESNWAPLSGGFAAPLSSVGTHSRIPVLASGGGTLAATWQDGTGSSDVMAAIWDGSDWIGLAGSAGADGLTLATGGAAVDPAMAVDGGGRPLVVWDQGTATASDVWLRHWNGSIWEELSASASGGGISNTVEEVARPAVTLDASDRPIVAWVHKAIGGSFIYLRAWNVTSWSELGGSATGTGVSTFGNEASWPALAHDGTTLYVAWQDGTAIYLRQWDGVNWSGLGGSGSGAGIGGNVQNASANPALAVAAGGRPAVAWAEDVPGAGVAIYFKYWTGSAWEALAGSASGSGISGFVGWAERAALAYDDAGMPWVAWHDDRGGPDQIFLRRWNGTAWQELGYSTPPTGGISATSKVSHQAAVAIGPDGHPVVVWTESFSSSDRLFLRQWDGSTWIELGGSGSGDGIGSVTGSACCGRVAVAADGRIALAYQDVSGGSPDDVYFRRWTGSTWEELGSSATGEGLSGPEDGEDPVVAIRRDGSPVVAYQSIGATDVIRVTTWNGSNWTGYAGSEIGFGISSPAADSRQPVLALDAADNPVVAWEESSGIDDQIFVRRWTGSAWEELAGSASGGGISGTRVDSERPDIVIDTAGNPLVAWREGRSPTAVQLRRWNGSGWQELGGSATGAGLSDSTTAAGRPFVAIDSAGRPVVTWRQQVGITAEVYARRWNGTVWEGIDGSATGGGVSNSDAQTSAPRIAAGDNVCITWSEAVGPMEQVLLRCHR